MRGGKGGPRATGLEPGSRPRPRRPGPRRAGASPRAWAVAWPRPGLRSSAEHSTFKFDQTQPSTSIQHAETRAETGTRTETETETGTGTETATATETEPETATDRNRDRAPYLGPLGKGQEGGSLGTRRRNQRKTTSRSHSHSRDVASLAKLAIMYM